MAYHSRGLGVYLEHILSGGCCVGNSRVGEWSVGRRGCYGPGCVICDRERSVCTGVAHVIPLVVLILAKK